MIRAHGERRTDADCTSADVLTPPERAAARRDRHEPAQQPARAARTIWADVAYIRAVLERWRSQ